jgi:hypothetical protein
MKSRPSRTPSLVRLLTLSGQNRVNELGQNPILVEDMRKVFYTRPRVPPSTGSVLAQEHSANVNSIFCLGQQIDVSRPNDAVR